ncbi:protein-export membrane protein SecD [Thermocrinis albus DSM 14484]|uniref:Protein translocase subunit SecD n=1 Tax=Thermocrinis albus (strain DSM 14484 / JCM 11386 / HI 11/12) TaxID=638303 RepID=D3SL11_THEAH|nr:protein translocase subunit SecD [Thermocrinis albus]ADC89441.1 protein-export membrane protein SecD [Thermocrinis albus DSM 14484]
MRGFYANLILLLVIVLSCLAILYYRPPNLGLDLKGGVSMVLEPDLAYALRQEYERYSSEVYAQLRDKGIQVLDVIPSEKGLKVELLQPQDSQKVGQLIKEKFPSFETFTEERGGLYLKLKEEEIKKLQLGILEQTLDVIRKRIDELGVVQPVITRLGENRILVELPGVTDIERAKKVIGRTALLELKLVVDTGPKEKLITELTKDTELLPSLKGDEWFLLERKPVITGADLKTAYTSTDDMGSPAVTFELTDRGSKVFAEATEKNIGRRLAIVLDGKVVSAPVIRSRISDRGQISGGFTLEEAQNLAIVLRAGALPTNVLFLQETVVGPYLGKDAVEQGFKSGIVGFLLLVLLLVGRYKTAGVTANLSILLNTLMLFALMSLLGATLTLPGIAGIVLNMGIAVDSNVLIFERVREELRLGNSVRKAIELGYRRTWNTVWDTHVTLLVASLILFQFGSGPVKGFATTLTVGTIASFVSNVYFAKYFLEVLYKLKLFKI